MWALSELLSESGKLWKTGHTTPPYLMAAMAGLERTWFSPEDAVWKHFFLILRDDHLLPEYTRSLFRERRGGVGEACGEPASRRFPNDSCLLVLTPVCFHIEQASVTDKILQKWQCMTLMIGHRKYHSLCFVVSDPLFWWQGAGLGAPAVTSWTHSSSPGKGPRGEQRPLANCHMVTRACDLSKLRIPH